MKAKHARRTVLITAVLLLAGIGGCPQPSEDSLLQGVWEVVPEDGFNGPLAKLFITFDNSDQLSDVSYTFTSGVTVNWHDPDGSTSVDGDTIHVTCTVGGNGFTFDGTLDSSTSPASADGSLTLEFELGDLGVSMPRGPATLVKQ